MRVFRHLVVVGVGAAITFSNVGRATSAPPPTPPQDNSTESNQLELGSDFKSIPKTAGERKSQEGHVVSVSPPSQSQEPKIDSSPLNFGPDFKSASKSASRPLSETSPQSSAESQPSQASLGKRATQPASPAIAPPNLRSAIEATVTPAAQRTGEDRPLQFGADLKSVAKPNVPAEKAGPVQKPVPYHQAKLNVAQSAAALRPGTGRQRASSRNPSKQAASNRLTAQAPTPSLTPLETTPAPLPTRTPLDTFPPLTPNGTLQTQPADSLEPNPNPLSFPTQPDEVRIEQTQALSLQQVIDLARRNSPAIRVAEQQLEQSRAALREQRAELYPNLNLQIEYNRQVSASGELGVRAQQRRLDNLERKGQLPPNAEEPENLGSNALNSSLQLSYDLDLFGRRRANIRAAEEQTRFRELEVERLVEQLRSDVTSAYYDLQEADGQVAIRQASVRNAQKSLQDAEALERAGVGTRFAVLQAQANLANEQQRLNEAIRDQRVRRRRLAELLNVNQTADLTAADPVEQAGSWRLSLEESIVLALKNRAELEQQLVQRSFSEQQRRAIVASRRPQVSLFANYNLLGLDPDDSDPFVARGWADGYSLGARLTWNIFDGGGAQARAEQRAVDREIAETRFEQLRNQIRREVEQAYFELESSFASIETAEAGVTQAREALRLARLRFQAGVGTQTDVIQAETDLTRAERNRLIAIIGYNRALSALQRAVSNLPSNTLSDVP